MSGARKFSRHEGMQIWGARVADKCLLALVGAHVKERIWRLLLGSRKIWDNAR